MVLFSCSQCGKKLSIKEEHGGKRVRCPKCQSITTIPGQSSGTNVDECYGTAEPSPRPDVPLQGQAGPADKLPNPQRVNHPLIGDVLSGSLTDTLMYQTWQPQEKDLQAFLAPPQLPGEIGRLGSYRILKLLGVGGMGMVFQAEETALKRQVALKVMLPPLAVKETNRRRFRREAQHAAMVEHDHVISILNIGEVNGLPYLVMPLLKGESLEEILKQGMRLPAPEILRIGREIATGLAAAHQQKLIHRDIKPANIWLESSAVYSPTAAEPQQAENGPIPGGRVRILDFGLARVADEHANLTQSGAIIGTPAYMAPEQARSEGLDGRSDLFSLGCVLYRMCTGQIPFHKPDTIGTLMAVTMETPTPIREINPEIPFKLAALVDMLMAKKRENRPASAGLVVEIIKDLEREYQEGGLTSGTRARTSGALPSFAEPLSHMDSRTPTADSHFPRAGSLAAADSRTPFVESLAVLEPPDPKTEIHKPPTRKRWWAGVAASVVLVAAMAGAAVINLGGNHPPKNNGNPGKTNGPPISFAIKSLDELDAKTIPQGEAEFTPKELVKVVGSRRWHHWGPVAEIVVSPDGQLVASRGTDHAIRVWDMATGVERFILRHPRPVHGLAFAPDGQTLYSTTELDLASGELKKWSMLTGQELTENTAKVTSPGGAMSRIVFNKERNLIVLGASPVQDYYVQMWDPKKPALLRAWRGLAARNPGDPPPQVLALSPDGKTLVNDIAKNDKGTLELWSITNLLNQGFQRTLPAHAEAVKAAAFSPDSKLLASAGEDGLVILWDPVTLAKERTLDHGGKVLAVEFSYDGSTVASASSDGTIKLWNAATGKLLHTLNGHQGPVQSLAFVPRKQFQAKDEPQEVLVSGGADGTIRRWDVFQGKQIVSGPWTPGAILAVAFSPDGKAMAWAGANREVWLWKFAENPLVVGTHEEPVESLAFSPTYLASASAKTIHIWDVARGILHKTVEPPLSVHSLSFNPAGTLLAVGGPDGGRIYDVKSSEEMTRLPQSIHCLAFSPDGKTVAAAGAASLLVDRKQAVAASKVALWNLEGKELDKSVIGNISTPITSIAWSPDGQTLATGHVWRKPGEPAPQPASVQIWKADNLAEPLVIKDAKAEAITAVAFSPDGKKLAWVNDLGMLVVRAVGSQNVIWNGELPGPVHQFAFAPDGRHLATANANGTVYILRLP